MALCCVSQCRRWNVIPESIEAAGKCHDLVLVFKTPSVTEWWGWGTVKVAWVTRRKVFPNESVWGLQVTPVDLAWRQDWREEPLPGQAWPLG